MLEIVELKNYGIRESCLLNKKTGKKIFYIEKKISRFTGVYFKNDDNFFAIFPTSNGPIAYYKGEEYLINRDLTIVVQKEGKNRKFEIKEYNIVINYIEPQYIGFDAWSSEIDLDLFYMISQRYKKEEFYNQFTFC